MPCANNIAAANNPIFRKIKRGMIAVDHSPPFFCLLDEQIGCIFWNPVSAATRQNA
jgi:hypothetical protein